MKAMPHLRADVKGRFVSKLCQHRCTSLSALSAHDGADSGMLGQEYILLQCNMLNGTTSYQRRVLLWLHCYLCLHACKRLYGVIAS